MPNISYTIFSFKLFTTVAWFKFRYVFNTSFPSRYWNFSLKFFLLSLKIVYIGFQDLKWTLVSFHAFSKVFFVYCLKTCFRELSLCSSFSIWQYHCGWIILFFATSVHDSCPDYNLLSLALKVPSAGSLSISALKFGISVCISFKQKGPFVAGIVKTYLLPFCYPLSHFQLGNL